MTAAATGIARQRSVSHPDRIPSPNSARLSGIEAAAVADAFRQAMRKPDFADTYVVPSLKFSATILINCL